MTNKKLLISLNTISQVRQFDKFIQSGQKIVVYPDDTIRIQEVDFDSANVKEIIKSKVTIKPGDDRNGNYIYTIENRSDENLV